MPALLKKKFVVVALEHDEETGDTPMLLKSYHDTEYDALEEIHRIRFPFTNYMIMECYIPNPEAT